MRKRERSALPKKWNLRGEIPDMVVGVC